MSRLMCLVQRHPLYKAMETGNISEKQAVLDAMTPDIMGQMRPNEISQDTEEVYSKTVEEYVRNGHNRHIIDELIRFMDMLPDDAKVLDVGCGPGRDTFFMSVTDRVFRISLMNRKDIDGKTTLDKFHVPTKGFSVIGIDRSVGMLRQAFNTYYGLMRADLFNPHKEPFFLLADMHAFESSIRLLNSGEPSGYDAVWSCTALFTHTPICFIQKAMRSVAKSLNSGGIFFTSYTNGRGGPYDNLRISRTGEIKYFSQPDPEGIRYHAERVGLRLIDQTLSNFIIDGKMAKKDLFCSQFFRKK